MAIGVTVNYTIEDLDFHNNNVQIKYLLDNDEAPLTKRYLEVYDFNLIFYLWHQPLWQFLQMKPEE